MHLVYLLAFTLAISVFGVIVIGSAQQSVQKSQIIGLLIGIVVMIIVSLMDYNYLLHFYWLIYFMVILLLLAVMFVGDSTFGAQRWIDLGFFRFQPSELCKILLVLFFARYFAEREDSINRPSTLILTVVLALIPLALILKQPDLSTTIVTALMFASMFFVSGVKRSYVLIAMAVAIPLIAGFILFAANTKPGETFLPKYQHTRIVAWLYPEEYTTEEGMQQQNSIIAIGSGQLNGKGLNNDEVASLKNGNFVPQPQTDFIFAVVGEELGFLGCCAVILLILLIVIECFAIGKRAQDTQGKLICFGVGSLIGFQALINMAVTTGLCPNTGLTLPFVSYGLTSLVSLYIGIGFVLNVGLRPQKYERQVNLV